MNKPKGILFDLGGTLLDTKSFDTLAGNAHCLAISNNPNKLTPQDVQKAATTLANEIQPLCELSMLEFKNECFQKLLYEQLGITFNISSSELELEFWKAAAKFTPEPGIFEVLDYLRAQKIKMGVISNFTFSGEVLKWELKRQNLLSYFEFVIASADYGIRKPHPLLFSVAIRKLGLNPTEIWLVDDKLQYIVGALKAKFFAVWYNKNRENTLDINPDIEIRSWKEFLDIICNCP